jgi:transposase
MNWFGWQKRCQRLTAENRQLRERNAWLEQRLQAVEAQNTRLTQCLAAAKKHSGNSSKPPSSDIVKPQGQRRIGGQKGHPKHERPAFTPDQVNQRIPFRLEPCPVDPSHRITPAEGPEHQRTIQQVELVAKPFRVFEYTADSIWRQDCGC